MPYFLLIVCVFSLIACKNEKKKILLEFEDVNSYVIERDVQKMSFVDGEPIEISITESSIQKEISLSSIIDSINFVKLDSRSEAIVGSIDKILFSDGYIYVLDRNKTKSLKKFAEDGIYICDIGKVGEGPDEYVEPTDFIILGNSVIVYDQFSCKLRYYSMDGQIMKIRKLPFMCLQFYAFFPDNFIFNTLDADNQHLQTIENYSIFTTDSLFHLKERGFYRKKDLYSSIFIPTNFHISDGQLYYHPPFRNTIYSIDVNGKIQAQYKLDFGEKELPETYLLTKNWKSFLKESDKEQYCFFPGEYFTVGAFLYFSYIRAHKVYRCFYSLRDGGLVCSSLVKNDLIPVFPFNNILGAVDGHLIGYVYPYEIVQARDKCNKEEWEKTIGKQSVEISSSLKEEDNPVIIKYYLKK